MARLWRQLKRLFRNPWIWRDVTYEWPPEDAAIIIAQPYTNQNKTQWSFRSGYSYTEIEYGDYDAVGHPIYCLLSDDGDDIDYGGLTYWRYAQPLAPGLFTRLRSYIKECLWFKRSKMKPKVLKTLDTWWPEE